MSRLPDFLVIGAARCGTTSIDAYLRQHPDVRMSSQKETDYFSFGDLPADEVPPGASPYRVPTLDAYRRQFAGAGRAHAVGEVSPTYLAFPRSAERIAGAIPDAKLICVLRDPVERAYSHWAMVRRAGLEPLSEFEAAVDAEDERVRRDGSLRYAYTRASLYHAGLARYFARFPRERMLVLRFEDFAHDPAATMRVVYRFIGVDADFVPDVRVRHHRSLLPRARWIGTAVARTRALRRLVLPRLPPRLVARIGDAIMRAPPPLAPGTRARLLPRFEDDVRELERLLGRDLAPWRSP